jgi:hypothetical protein
VASGREFAIFLPVLEFYQINNTLEGMLSIHLGDDGWGHSHFIIEVVRFEELFVMPYITSARKLLTS